MSFQPLFEVLGPGSQVITWQSHAPRQGADDVARFGNAASDSGGDIVGRHQPESLDCGR
jgi:hypothetical protein